jgi:dCMP deaminase
VLPVKDEKTEGEDAHFIAYANIVAKFSPDIKRQVGAIVAKDGHKIADGFNKPVPKKIIKDYFCQSKQPYMVHAEMDALSKITAKQAKDSTIYITLAPCTDCCKMIAAYNIQRVVYRDEHKDSNINYLKELGITVDKYEQIFFNCGKIESLQE